MNLHNLFFSAVLLQFNSDFFSLFFYFCHKDNPRYFEENFLRKNVFEVIDYKNIRFSELGSSVSLAIYTWPPEVRSQEAEAEYGPCQEWDGMLSYKSPGSSQSSLPGTLSGKQHKTLSQRRRWGPAHRLPSDLCTCWNPTFTGKQTCAYLHVHKTFKAVYRLNEYLVKFKLLFCCCCF